MARATVATGFVEIQAALDRSSFTRALRRGERDAERSGESSATRFAKSFGKVLAPELAAGIKPAAVAVGGLFGAQLAAQATLAFVSGTKKLIHGAGAIGALLPAVAAAGTAAFATLKVALSGVGDALSSGLAGDVEKFDEALKKLSPSAREVVGEIVAFRDRFRDLRREVQQSLFAPLVGEIGPLIDRYLRPLGGMLTTIAAGFAAGASAIAGFLGHENTVARFRFAFDNIAAAVNTIASRALPALVRAFEPLIVVGSTFLPGFATSFADLTDRFAAFMQRVSASGELQAWIQAGIDGLASLWHTGERVWGILKDVGAAMESALAAAGIHSGSALSTMERLAEKTRAWVESIEGQRTIGAIFDYVRGTIDRVSEAFGRLWTDGIEPILPDLEDFFAEFDEFRKDVLEALVDELIVLFRDVLPPVIEGLTRMLDVINSNPALSALVTHALALVLVFGGLAKILAPVTSLLGGLAAPVYAVLAGMAVLGFWVSWVKDRWGEWTSLIPLWTGPIGIAAFLLVGLSKAFDGLKAAAGIAFDFIAGKVLWVWQNVLYPVWSAIWGFITNTLIPIFGRLWGFVNTVWNGITTAITAAWTFIRDNVWSPIWSFISDRLIPIFSTLWGHVVTIWGSLRDVTGRIWGEIVERVRGPVNTIIRIWNTMADAVNDVLDAIGLGRPLPDGISLIAETGGQAANSTQAANAIARMASGGVVPFITNGPRAIVGEGNPNFPEYVIPTDPKHRGRALKLYESLGFRLMGLGGILGSVGDAFGAGAGWVGDRIGDVVGAVRGGLAALAAPANEAAKRAIDATVPEVMKLRSVAQEVREAAWRWVTGADSNLPLPEPTPSVSGGPSGALGLVGNALAALPTWRAMFPWMTIGGRAPRANRSDHPVGRAMDLMTSSNAIAQQIIATFVRQAGAKYWIWSRQIASSPGWAPRHYSGPNPHTDHVHLSYFGRGGVVERDGLGFLHKDEAVLPADLTRRIEGSGPSTVNNFYVEVHVPAGTNDPAAYGRQVARGFEEALAHRRIILDARIR